MTSILINGFDHFYWVDHQVSNREERKKERERERKREREEGRKEGRKKKEKCVLISHVHKKILSSLFNLI